MIQNVNFGLSFWPGYAQGSKPTARQQHAEAPEQKAPAEARAFHKLS